jgi:hypothetical protein
MRVDAFQPELEAHPAGAEDSEGGDSDQVGHDVTSTADIRLFEHTPLCRSISGRSTILVSTAPWR